MLSVTHLEHYIAKRKLSNGSRWTESFVRLNPTNTNQDGFIDVHEYYWAPDTEKQITVPEILQWAEQTLDGTIEFYSRRENKDLLDQLLENQNRQGFFKFRLRSLTIFLRLFNFIYPVLRLALFLILFLAGPFLKGRFLESAWKLSKTLLTPPLVDYVGDVAIYTKTDPKVPPWGNHQDRTALETRPTHWLNFALSTPCCTSGIRSVSNAHQA